MSPLRSFYVDHHFIFGTLQVLWLRLIKRFELSSELLAWWHFALLLDGVREKVKYRTRAHLEAEWNSRERETRQDDVQRTCGVVLRYIFQSRLLPL
jgi:hypothetical protein